MMTFLRLSGLVRGFFLFLARSADLSLAWLVLNVIHDAVKRKKKKEEEPWKSFRKKVRKKIGGRNE